MLFSLMCFPFNLGFQFSHWSFCWN